MTLTDGALATFVVGLVTFVQWWVSERARTRQRDTEMVHWGGEVIDLMAALEARCEFPEFESDAPTYFQLIVKASALIDRGRLFFPNVITKSIATTAKPPAYRGHRVALLDELVRTYLLAKHLADPANGFEPIFKRKMREARRRFVSGLQTEMGRTLRRSSREKAGVSIPADPRKW
ncbi:MAG TPA: hypothetical protein VGL30_15655 [Phenylobacterium sp.]